MEERGFDALQTGMGAFVLIIATILLTLIILAGGFFMRYKEMEWRAAHKDESTAKDDSPAHKAGT